MRIDYKIIATIIDEYTSLDPLEAYYRKDSIRSKHANGFTRHTGEVISSIMLPSFRVLDIGCGDGHTLIKFANRFREGIGFDESKYIFDKAIGNARQSRIRNVQFVLGKAVSLPFDDNSFDYVFTERGPLGHSDVTLSEVVRVLKIDGFIFIETLGSRHMMELPKSDGRMLGDTLLTTVEIERDRFKRYGIEPMLIMSQINIIQFETIYDWFEYYCSIQRYNERPAPWPSDEDFLSAFKKNAESRDGTINLTHHHIWIGGILRNVTGTKQVNGKRDK